jgi:hypothetical protein
VVEAANIAPVVVTVLCLGSAEFEKLSGGSLRLSSQQKCSMPIVARAQFAEWALWKDRLWRAKRMFVDSADVKTVMSVKEHGALSLAVDLGAAAIILINVATLVLATSSSYSLPP